MFDDVRGAGYFLAVELVRDKANKTPIRGDDARRLKAHLIAEVLAGVLKNTIVA